MSTAETRPDPECVFDLSLSISGARTSLLLAGRLELEVFGIKPRKDGMILVQHTLSTRLERLKKSSEESSGSRRIS